MAGLAFFLFLLVARPSSGAPACSISWTGKAGDGQWANASNWADAATGEARIPLPTDWVCLKDGSNATATINDVSVAVLGIVADTPLELKSGSLELTDVENPSTMRYFDQDPGTTFGGAASVTFTGGRASAAYDWNGGRQVGPGTTTIAFDATLALAGGSSQPLTLDRPLVNNGALGAGANGTLLTSVNIQNNGTFASGSDYTIQASGDLIPEFTNEGSFIVGQQTTISLSRIDLANDGAVVLEGALSVEGNYTQGSSAILETFIPTTLDTVGTMNVSGRAALAGRHQVIYSTDPGPGASFDAVAYGAGAGKFDQEDPGWDYTYGSKAVTLQRKTTASVTVNGQGADGREQFTADKPDNFGHNTISGSGTLTYDSGTAIQLAADAQDASGDTFDHWVVDGDTTSSANPIGVTLDRDHTLVAVYTPAPPVTHTLDVGSQNPDSGVTISIDPDPAHQGSDSTPFQRTYDDGTAVTLTAPSTLDNGNTFDHWELDGTPVDSSSSTLDLTMDADHSAVAVYATPPPPPTHTLSVTSLNPESGVGIVVLPPDRNKDANGSTPFDRSYNDGAIVTLTAQDPSPTGSRFDHWEEDGQTVGTGNDPQVDVTMDADHALEAVYVTPLQGKSNGRIAFQTNASGDSEIYSSNPDGSATDDLTNNHHVEDYEPTYNADSSQIAFTRNVAGNFDVWVMNADGTRQHDVTNASSFEADPTWSPDGSRIAFITNRNTGNNQLWVMNADGTDQHALVTGGYSGFPSWSPDGTEIVFHHNPFGYGNFDIWTVRPDGTHLTSLTDDAADETPEWSPDGSKIVYKHVLSSTAARIETYDVATGHQTQLTDGSDFDDLPTYSPDGTKIAFSRHNHLYTMAADGSNQQPLSLLGTSDSAPAWGSTPERDPNAGMVWNLKDDFQVVPNQANPNPDHYGNSDVWYFMEGAGNPRDPQTYTLMPDFHNDRECQQYWLSSNPSLSAPIVVKNTCSGGMIDHPGPGVDNGAASNRVVVIGWKSPIDGFVDVSASFADADGNCGNGVRWFFDKGTQNLALGTIDNGGGPRGFSTTVQVGQGQFLYFVTDPRDEFFCDSTAVTISITENTNPPPTPQTLSVGTQGADDTAPVTVSPPDKHEHASSNRPSDYSYDRGSTVTLTAAQVAENGATFDHWLIDDEIRRTENPTQVTMNGDHSAQAVYAAAAQTTQTLHVASQGAQDSAQMVLNPPDNNGHDRTTTPSDFTYDTGTSVTLTADASAESGATFDHWQVDGQTVEGNPVTVTMDADHSATAVYTPYYALGVRSQNPNEGVDITVTPSDRSEQGNGTTPFDRTYASGTDVHLTAPAQAGGNDFRYWQIDAGEGVRIDQSTSTEVRMDASHTATAVYAPPQPTEQPPQTSKLAVDDVSVTEPDEGQNASAVFDVHLTPSSLAPVTVDYSTSDGTAKTGRDYESTGGRLTFQPGETSKAVVVPIIGDNLNEDNETFGLTLSNPIGATIDRGSATGTIVDNDPEPTVTIGDIAVSEGDSGQTIATFTAALSAPSGRGIGFDWTTSDGTAQSSSDYQPAHGTVYFDPGEMKKTISVDVTPNTKQDGNRTFFIRITSATNVQTSRSEAKATILDDDGPPPPVFRQAIDAGPVSGTVFVRLPGTTQFIPLTEGEQFPIGTTIDARKGRVTVSISDGAGGVQSADFYEGIFTIAQQTVDGVLVLKLVGGDFSICNTARSLEANKPPPKSVRHLWGNGKGKFRTSGKYSSATVRGTIWLTDDRCDGTNTFVQEGIVAVLDFALNKTVLVSAGESYLAKAQVLKPKSTHRKSKKPKKKPKKH